jgi:hypothetical protein
MGTGLNISEYIDKKKNFPATKTVETLEIEFIYLINDYKLVINQFTQGQVDLLVGFDGSKRPRKGNFP